MFSWTALSSILLTLATSEALPVDQILEQFERDDPGIQELEAVFDAELDKVGPAEANWSVSGISAPAAVAAAKPSVVNPVLGEWRIGGNGVVTEGNEPLDVPTQLHRYSIENFHGKVDYHTYHRLAGISETIVVHTYGTIKKVGNAECQVTMGSEIISSLPLSSWSSDTTLTALLLARFVRDDPRTYCIIYRATVDGGYEQLAYTPEGQLYNGAVPAQIFFNTPRSEAAARIFAAGDTAAERD